MSSYQIISSPVTSLYGEMSVPGDKSISHRSIIFGSLAHGITNISGFLEGEDCLATISAFRQMGVKIEGPENGKLLIYGVGKYGLKKPQHEINCGNSGTSMRLLSGLLAAQSFDSHLIGDDSLMKRPMARVTIPLTMIGADVSTQSNGLAPICVVGGAKLHGVEYLMPQASAQVKSCLLIAGLYAEGTTMVIEPEVTRNHTELMLKTFSYPVEINNNKISIDAGSSLVATNISIPGDISSAAFFIVAATLIPGSNITICDVGINPTRTGVIHILHKMGADISFHNKRMFGGEEVADINICYKELNGIEIPRELVSLAIDEFPVIFIAAACASGKTTLKGAEELRHKETDRINAMSIGLLNLGIDVSVIDDVIIINGGKFNGAKVDSFGDHRVAMAFAIAGAVAKSPIKIDNCENIATSFPNFISTANAQGFSMQKNIYE